MSEHYVANKSRFSTTGLILLFVLPWIDTAQGALYVSPNGSDANPGTRQHPFATIDRARREVRLLRDQGNAIDIAVSIRGGTYSIDKTIVFTSADSAGPGQTITYAAYPGETPVISSGVRVRKWTELTDFPKALPESARGHIWVADVAFIRAIINRQSPSPSAATPTTRTQLFYTLYDAGKSLPRARGPRFSMVKTPLTDRSDHTTFMFPAGALKNWPDMYNADLNIIPLRKWVSNILPIRDIDEDTGIGHAAPGTYTLIKHYNNSNNGVAHIENVMAVLDEPGEWVLDSKHDKLYFWPVNAQPGNDIVVPVLTELIRVQGQTDYEGAHDEPVRNLVFEGLTLTCADRFPFQGQTGWGVQHDWERYDSPSAMMRFRGSENCTVKDCHFTEAGSSGLRFDLYSQDNYVVGNHIEHLGGVGILLAGYGPGVKDVNRNNTIVHNSIHDIGQMYHGSPGIFIWQSGHNRVLNNRLYNLPYTGMCITGRIVWDPSGHQECSRTIRWHEVGGKGVADDFSNRDTTWQQRKKYLHARDNLIERNDIHDAMQICGDGNCIYISGAGGGNRLIENYCHHSPSFRMNSAIRCDDDQEETLIERNIIFRMGGNAEGLMIKGNNDLIENLLVDLRTVEGHRGYLRFHSGDVRGSVIQRNIFYSCTKGQNAFRRGEGDLSDTNADYNIYFSTVEPDWGIKHIEAYRKDGIEMHSIQADPLFVDIEQENFTFKPQSPALKLGLTQPVKVGSTGPQGQYRDLFYE